MADSPSEPHFTTMKYLALLALLVAPAVMAAAPESFCALPTASGELREPQHSALQWARALKPLGYDKCSFCQAFLATFDQLIYEGPVKDGISEVAVQFCEAAQLYDPPVCRGAVAAFAEILLHATSLEYVDPASRCHQLYPDCPAAAIFGPPKVEWSPDTHLEGELSGKFFHISDVHFDPDYTVGSPAECSEPLCCRNDDGRVLGGRRAGVWGDYNCDPPRNLVKHAFKTMAATAPDADFVVWTGDDPPHNIWSQSREYNLNATHTVTNLLSESLGDMMVFPALGNHEAFPVNQYHGNGQDAWLFDSLADAWSQWLPEEAVETFRRFGYYTVKATKKLRMVALNTNLCIQENYWLKANHTDTEVELCWLERVLDMAREHDERVYIYGHGPTSHDCYDFWGDAYVALIQRYSDIVAGQFFGHTHKDSFVLYRDDKGEPTNVAFVAPSITTYTKLNPSFRQFDYDIPTATLLDYHQYRAENITAASESGIAPAFHLGYSARQHYKLDDMSAASWQSAVYDNMVDDDFFGDWWFQHRSGYLPSSWNNGTRVGTMCTVWCSTTGCTDHCGAHADVCLPNPAAAACLAAK
eukprot:PLAT15323.1.p1 GENE.PLAT15323.1~~PLAT15323.1.p1  ORF type:complete len:585 (-),score=266.44 PLAT15323.1:219-1973(-)